MQQVLKSMFITAVLALSTPVLAYDWVKVDVDRGEIVIREDSGKLLSADWIGCSDNGLVKHVRVLEHVLPNGEVLTYNKVYFWDQLQPDSFAKYPELYDAMFEHCEAYAVLKQQRVY